MRHVCRAVVYTLLAVVMLAVPALVSPSDARAGIGWCKSDPVVLIDNHIVDIFVSAPLHAPLVVTGPTRIVITVPVGVAAAVVITDLGFGRGELVRIVESPKLQTTSSGVEVHVAVFVPTGERALPVMVEFAPNIVGLLAPRQATGSANAWVTLTTVV